MVAFSYTLVVLHNFFRLVRGMLRQLQEDEVHTQEKARRFIGSELRFKYSDANLMTDEEVAVMFLRQSVCIHLENFDDKMRLLTYGLPDTPHF